MRCAMRSGVRFFDAPLGQGAFLEDDPGAASAGADLPPANFLRCPSGTRGGPELTFRSVAFCGVNVAFLRFPVTYELLRCFAANRSTTVSIGVSPDANFCCYALGVKLRAYSDGCNSA